MKWWLDESFAFTLRLNDSDRVAKYETGSSSRTEHDFIRSKQANDIANRDTEYTGSLEHTSLLPTFVYILVTRLEDRIVRMREFRVTSPLRAGSLVLLSLQSFFPVPVTSFESSPSFPEDEAVLLAGAPVRVDGNGDGGKMTKVHEEGRCAMRGHCGKQSFFGGELPCLDNGVAREPEKDVRDKLVGLCGEKWEEGAVCCEDEQVS